MQTTIDNDPSHIPADDRDSAEFPPPSSPQASRAGSTAQWGGLLLILSLGILLWTPHLRDWWDISRKDDLISHAPLLFGVTLAYFWVLRDRFRQWDAADLRGLALLAFSTFFFIASYFAEVTLFKFLSLIGMTAGAIGYLAGPRALAAAMGPLGFLLFVLPWPTMLVERVSFPLQLMSSSYAALLSGMLGLPIVREGVKLSVVPELNAKPVYSVLVAQACSGLTSLLVLLALGYLVACITPTDRWKKALLVVAMIPLALLTNTLRLTFILLAGANHSVELAQWVHDHETPFLILLSSFAILGIRKGILSWEEAQQKRRQPSPVSSESIPNAREDAAPLERTIHEEEHAVV